MRVLSLGAGVQSSTLLLMACHGDHGQLELDFDGCGVLCPAGEVA